MISQELKNKAHKLRLGGKTYNEISKELGVSKSSLSLWFSKSKDLSQIKEYNILKNRSDSLKRITKINHIRRLRLKELYLQNICDAEKEFDKNKINPVFIGALMLYLGEGDKSHDNHLFRIGNVDPNVLLITTRFVQQFLPESFKKIKFWLLCYPDHDMKKCENWWLERLNLGRTQMYKTQVIAGRHISKRLPFGVGNITIGGKMMKMKVLKWVDLMSEYLMRS